jgi:uncharacterized protein
MVITAAKSKLVPKTEPKSQISDKLDSSKTQNIALKRKQTEYVLKDLRIMYNKPMPRVVQSQKDILVKIGSIATELKQLGITRLGLFGSFAYGTPTKKSDVDMLVRFKEITFDSYMHTHSLLESTFGRNVDLVIESDLKPDLQYVKERAIYVKI